MKSIMQTRRGPTFALLLVGLVAMSGMTAAQTNPKGSTEHFTATAANVNNAGDPLKIDLLRWSTDAEREQAVKAFTEKGEKEFASTLEKAPTLGYVWTSESAGYSVRYAHRIQTPDGGERIIVVTDRRLGAWDPRVWKPNGTITSTDYPFTVIELRLGRQKTGTGKVSLTAKVTVDTEAKTVALDNYAGAPVMLEKAQRVVSPQS
jgi:hypothetical protein